MTSCPKTGEKTCRCRQKRLAVGLLLLALAVGLLLAALAVARTKGKLSKKT